MSNAVDEKISRDFLPIRTVMPKSKSRREARKPVRPFPLVTGVTVNAGMTAGHFLLDGVL